MPTRKLPDDPSLEHLKKQAKTLLKQVQAEAPEAVALAAEFHPTGVDNLAGAQLVLARQYGFASWAKLVHHLELVDHYSRSPHRQTVGGPLDTPERRADEFLKLATLHYGQDDSARQLTARQLLDQFPEVASSNIYTMVVAAEPSVVAGALAADPAAATREGGPYRWEPLLYLTYSRLPADDRVAVAKLLLDNGADANAGYLWQGLPSPFTAITGAFGRGEGNQPPHQNRLELARLLLESGADANDSQTMYNCGPGCPPPYDDAHLELLLEFGLGKGDGGPWHERMTTAHPTPQQLLEDELVFASHQGFLHRVELVLAQGTDPEGRGTQHPGFGGHRAYELAAIQGHNEIAKLLLDEGAAPLDEVDELLAAAMRGEVVEPDPGLAARAVARNRQLPIRAAEIGATQALEPLQRLGFNLNVSRMGTPLHLAAINGHLATVQKLIELGADPTVEDPNYHNTPRGWAVYANHQDVVDYLDAL